MQEATEKMGFDLHSSRPSGKVAVFCTTFLPYSQTFIWDELRSHQRYVADVFAWRRQNAHLFPGRLHVAQPWYPITRRCSKFDSALSTGSHVLIHAHFGWSGVLAVPFARRHHLPLVVSFHGLDVALLAGSGPGSPRVWPYILRARGMLTTMTLGLCASSDLLETLSELGVPRDRLLEHRLGIDTDIFRPGARSPARFRVAMVGRFVPKKGFADGIKSFAMLAADRTDAELVIAGSGPLDRELRSLCAALGIVERVRFLGALAHAEVAALLASSDVLLAPSRMAADGDRDSGLIAAKEASSCGCVPIATRHGGLPSIIDEGVTGFLVAERDIEAMAVRLAAVASDPAMRSAMAVAARQKMIREYGLHSSVSRLEECYDEASRRHGAHASIRAKEW